MGAGLPVATMRVEPDRILELKRRFEDCRSKVADFVYANRDRLASIPPPGADPRSAKTVAALGANGESAVRAAQGYLDQLSAVVASLSEMARAYAGAEDENRQALTRTAE